MIILNTPFRWSCCICGVILIGKKECKDNMCMYRMILAHEMTHAKRQKEMGCIKWLWKYITDKKFRINEELLACIAEIKKARACGEWWDFDYQDYYTWIRSFPYCASKKEALKFVKDLKKAIKE